jgi:hypothetical protein
MNLEQQKTLDDILSEYEQYEVDFVFPNEEKDVPIYLDIYLMYETSDEIWNEVQAMVFWYFNNLLKKYKNNKISEKKLLELLHFPEVSELGFGHCVKGVEGAGTAGKRAVLLKKTIFDNKEVKNIGLPALAKLAIQIEGFGPDLLSDMTASFALDNLLEYTAEQVKNYNLKTMTVNLQRGFDFRNKEWKPRLKVELPYFSNGECRILAPRHICRRMPIFSTDEFYKGFLKYVLQGEDISRQLAIGSIGKKPKVLIKDIEKRLEKQYKSLGFAARKIAEDRPDLVDAYVDNPHKFDSRRRPRKPKINWKKYIEELESMKAGNENSSKYSELLLKIFNALYDKCLLRGKLEEISINGIYRYDITFLNASTTSFFKVLQKTKIVDALVIVEAKNYEKTKVGNKEFYQGRSYTIKDKREFVFLVQRRDVSGKDIERAKEHYLRHGVIIFPLSDSDIIKMIELKEKLEKDFDSVLEERLQSILSA